jgi:tRNA(Arg) A34 adenosine deaminase TadA
MQGHSRDPFTDVEATWRTCFLLAWQSFQGGSVPVGAVLVDSRGNTVSSGRNRSQEPTGPAGHLAGSHIAHAELNALATLPPGEYRDHTLLTTLEPCFLCTAALRHSHVGTVRFAAPDPMVRGIERLPDLNQQMARRWARRQGPLGGPLQTWAALLPLISALERGADAVRQSHAEAMPRVLSLARTWAGAAADRLRALELDEALSQAWPDLLSCGP